MDLLKLQDLSFAIIMEILWIIMGPIIDYSDQPHTDFMLMLILKLNPFSTFHKMTLMYLVTWMW